MPTSVILFLNAWMIPLFDISEDILFRNLFLVFVPCLASNLFNFLLRIFYKMNKWRRGVKLIFELLTWFIYFFFFCSNTQLRLYITTKGDITLPYSNGLSKPLRTSSAEDQISDDINKMDCNLLIFYHK